MDALTYWVRDTLLPGEPIEPSKYDSKGRTALSALMDDMRKFSFEDHQAACDKFYDFYEYIAELIKGGGVNQPDQFSNNDHTDTDIDIDRIEGATPAFKCIVYLFNIFPVEFAEKLEVSVKKIVQLLVDHGADLSVKDKNGNTLLHYLATKSKGDVVEDLERKNWFLFLKDLKTSALEEIPQEKRLPLNCEVNRKGLSPLRLIAYSRYIGLSEAMWNAAKPFILPEVLEYSRSR